MLKASKQIKDWSYTAPENYENTEGPQRAGPRESLGSDQLVAAINLLSAASQPQPVLLPQLEHV